MYNGGISEETREENKRVREQVRQLEANYILKGERGSYLINKALITDFGFCRSVISLWKSEQIDFKQKNLNRVKQFLKEVE